MRLRKLGLPLFVHRVQPRIDVGYVAYVSAGLKHISLELKTKFTETVFAFAAFIMMDQFDDTTDSQSINEAAARQW
jgi:hypothetical protein